MFFQVRFLRYQRTSHCLGSSLLALFEGFSLRPFVCAEEGNGTDEEGDEDESAAAQKVKGKYRKQNEAREGDQGERTLAHVVSRLVEDCSLLTG